jgi:predicted HTH domain antitoxin
MVMTTEQNYAESIAEDVNETIRLEYRLGGSFTENEVKTLINIALEEFDSSFISFSEVNELVDYNLIGV